MTLYDWFMAFDWSKKVSLEGNTGPLFELIDDIIEHKSEEVEVTETDEYFELRLVSGGQKV